VSRRPGVPLKRSVFRHVVVRVVAIAALAVAAAPAIAQDPVLPDLAPPDLALRDIPRDLATVPVLYEGRSMPLESAGRLALYRLSGRNRVGELGSTGWFVRLLLDPFSAIEDKVFLVNNPATLDAIDYPDPHRGRYSYLDLYGSLGLLNSLAVGLSAVGRPLDATEQELVELGNNVLLFEGLASTFDLFRNAAPAAAGGGPAESELRRFLSTGEITRADLSELPGMLSLFPVRSADGIAWLTPSGAVSHLMQDPAAAPHLRDLLEAWDVVLPAFLLADSGALAHGSRLLAQGIQAVRSDGYELGPTGIEVLSTRLNPVRWAGVALGLALGLSLLLGRRTRAIQWVRLPVGVAVIFLTAAQIIRFLITHRPPVTDLPASFLFVAWIVVIVGFGLTLASKQAGRVGVFLSTLAGLGLIYLARLVTGGADIFGVVRAVLDTNFWLTTHVLVVTAGYGGVVAAGVAGHIYLIGRLYRPHQSASHQSTLRIMFVLMLAGLALAFLGTILGGIWADQSWGRFWGWDPKENGALLIVLWASIALHARVTRWFDNAAFASAAVFGNVVVLFSWLGVNLMGVGLHSYGFNDSSFVVLVGVSAAETVFAVGAWLWIRFGSSEKGMSRTTIASVHRDGDAVVITLRGDPVPHDRGQYLGVKPEGFDRAKPFSFVDTAEDSDRFLIGPSGPLSTYLANKARAGETVLVGRPSGEFVFGTHAGRDVVMVAGGVGIAPIVGLTREALAAGHTTTVICASRDHLYLDDDLRKLERENGDLVVLRLMSRPPEGWDGPVGRISTEAVETLLDGAGRTGAGADWYICGSCEFCATAREIARASGARDIFEEEFATALEAPPAPTFAADAVFLGPGGTGGRTVRIRPGQTILSASLDAGIEIPHSCMIGTCGECGCGIAGGGATQAVAPREAGPGDTVLTCVAYPGEPEGLVFSVEEKEK
jgi:ferredoxin-NADP reductase/ABC-type transport system involved in cytochrome c biogenesis permease subunit